MNFTENEKGVISLEACICVPIFLFLLMFIYGLMISFTGEQIIKHTLIQSGESLSLDSYATDKFGGLGSFDDIFSADGDPNIKEIILALYNEISQGTNEKYKYYSSSKKWYSDDKDALLTETVKNRFMAYLSGSSDNVEQKADEILKEIGVVNGINGIDFTESDVDDNGTLTLVLSYKQEFVFNFGGLAAFDRKLTMAIDMWGRKK